MSRIVIDAREYSTGTGRYVKTLVQQLEKIDTDNNYTILLKPRDMEAYQPAAANFEKLECPFKEFTFSEQLGFLKQLKSLRADLVHFPMVHQPVLYSGRVVTTMNDLTTLRFNNPIKNRLIFWFKQRVYAWVNRRVAKKSAAIITYSQFVKDDVAEYTKIATDKITVIPLAANPIADSPKSLPGLVDKKFILYVGRPLPHKNLERLLEAFRKLRAADPELLLVLGGKKDANYERLESMVRHRAIKGVLFTGFLEEGQLRWLYENCAAYVFPSLSEGFGLPGLEAMLHGAPVVSSHATCLPEIYGDAAQYFNPMDVQSIADALSQVLGDKTLRRELINKGKKQVAGYSWKTTAEKTLSIYKNSLGT